MLLISMSPGPYGRALLARGFDVGRLHRLAGLVAPAVAGVRDHRRDVDVGELRPRRHRGPRLAVEHNRDLSLLRTVDDLRAVERRERARDALAACLVARRA